MKQTSIVIDERLVAEVKRLTGFKTVRQLVDHALRELVRHRRQRDILRLKGQVAFEEENVRRKHSRLARECKKLDRGTEQAMAEE